MLMPYKMCVCVLEMNFIMWKKNSILINFRDLWRKLLDFLILHQGTTDAGTSDKVHINFNFPRHLWKWQEENTFMEHQT